MKYMDISLLVVIFVTSMINVEILIRQNEK